MVLPIKEVLAAWREGERLLDSLPPVHPDRETVMRSIAELRSLYQVMTDASALSQRKVDVSRAALARSAATIESVRRRLANGEPTDS